MASAGKPKGTSQEDKVARPDKSNTASKGMASQEKGHHAGPADLPADLDDQRPPGQIAKDAMDDDAA